MWAGCIAEQERLKGFLQYEATQITYYMLNWCVGVTQMQHNQQY